MAFESVTAAFEAEDLGVAHDAVDHRIRDGGNRLSAFFQGCPIASCQYLRED